MRSIPAKLVTWDEIAEWCADLGRMIVESGYRPDALIGLARGGWVPSRLVCDELVSKNLISLKTQHWGVTATKDGKARLVGGLQEDIEGKNVLIIDDITDTGDSLKLAYDHAEAMSPERVKTATMLHITHSNFVPDFYAREVVKENWTWFVFPWNYYEDMSTFIREILATGPLRDRDVLSQLRKNHGILMTEGRLEHTLGRLAKLGFIRRTGETWGIIVEEKQDSV